MQGANALVPLLIFPYLLAKIGSEAFSKLVVAESLSIIVLAFVLFGFDVTSIKKLANNESIEQDSELFSEVLYTRLLIFIALIPFTFFVYNYYGYSTLVMYSFWILIPLGHAFQSSYYYLYKQRNLVLAISTVFGRLTALILILVFVNDKDDVIKVPIILGGTYLISSLISFMFVLFYWKVKLISPNISSIIFQVKDSFSCFVSNSSVLLYRDLNVLIMSVVFKDETAISMYALAEKIVKSTQAVFRPISQFYFPKAALALRPYNKPNIKTLKLLWHFTYKQLMFFTITFSFIIVIVCFLDDYLIHYISVPVFNALLFAVPMHIVIYLAIPNYMFGMIGLNMLGADSLLAKMIFITGVINVVLCLVLSKSFGAPGAAICFVLSELLLLLFILFKYSFKASNL